MDALGAFLEENDLPVADPPDSYNGDEKYYAVFFHDPDGMRLEAMHYGRRREEEERRRSAELSRSFPRKRESRSSKLR